MPFVSLILSSGWSGNPFQEVTELLPPNTLPLPLLLPIYLPDEQMIVNNGESVVEVLFGPLFAHAVLL